MSNIKDWFTWDTMGEMADRIINERQDFPKDAFLEEVFSEEWEQMEMFARLSHISRVLARLLGDYPASLDIIRAIPTGPDAIWKLAVSQYVAVNGLDHLKESAAAMEHITKYTTCEFAVRPFIDKYPTKMLEILLEWSKSDNEHVRRLASEGTRYAIPWGARLQTVKENPGYALPILENLKDDPSEYVRKSVANNLNELSKIAPDLVINLVSKWKGGSKNTDWIVKHASRTLLKKSHPQILEIFGLTKPEGVSVNLLSVTPMVKLNDELVFSFEVINKTDEGIKLRIGYDIGFLKSNCKINLKENKISERVCKPGFTTIERKHKIFETSGRKIYFGRHELKITINGCVMAETEFMVCE
ncbi:MAG: DNA alkylation repair protein [Firmicutes bacterium]|nr:DNA alkylation repair protein [Bacillota bacterium]